MPINKNKNNSSGPLAGLLVIDASQGIAGPYCGATLASYGARVIKIDPPQGDWGRNVGYRYGSLSTYAIAYNQGKESIVLDLKKPEDLDCLYRLVAEADIFMESSRPGVAEKIGIDFETLKGHNPSLVYLSVSGFGQTGPYAERPCTDGVAQAYSGLVNGNVGLDGQPHKLDLPIVDITTGLYAFQSISMALFQRMKTGEAQYLDVNLVTSALEVQRAKLFEVCVEGESVAKLNVPSGIYECDSGNVAIALATEEHYARLVKALDAPELIEAPKFATFADRADHADELRSRIGEILARQTNQYWEETLGKAGIIVNAINSLQDVVEDKQFAEGGALHPVEHPGVGTFMVPVMPLRDITLPPAPELGQDTEAVLRELTTATK
ncbi:CaiB/BaiF CoA transferase family protein [Sneathiella chinensis]|uniref:CoA transferase n=1 Tax=Sneathiella chinensis TaxID=349750 RepID=A0ABQ5U7A7_9PROT|nr:CoA transferase [Sneathiella chinensis]GLQ08029.1 CoA transferase [Sneathiella chinensis]